MESKTWLTKISKMITSAVTEMAHPEAIPTVAAADNPLLFFVGVTNVLLMHFASSAKSVSEPVYH